MTFALTVRKQIVVVNRNIIRSLSTSSIRTKDWSEADTARLLSLVTRHGKDWKVISPHFEGRSLQAVRGRYTNMLNKYNLRRDIKNPPDTEVQTASEWTKKEEKELLMLININSKKRNEIAMFMENRSPVELFEKYTELKSVTEDWTEDMSHKLMEWAYAYNNDWNTIAKKMGAKTADECMRKWNMKISS